MSLINDRRMHREELHIKYTYEDTIDDRCDESYDKDELLTRTTGKAFKYRHYAFGRTGNVHDTLFRLVVKCCSGEAYNSMLSRCGRINK